MKEDFIERGLSNTGGNKSGHGRTTTEDTAKSESLRELKENKTRDTTRTTRDEETQT
jgi:hypothetical protein